MSNPVLPQPLVRLGRQAADAYWRRVPLLQRFKNRAPGLISFRDAYPSAPIDRIAPSTDVFLPQLTTLPLSAPAAHLQNETYSIPEDFVSCVPGGLVAGHGSVVLSAERHVIDETSTAAQMQYFLKREFYLRPKRIAKRAALLRSRFHNFYHWMVDCLPRLVALADSRWARSSPIHLLYTEPLAPYERFFLDRFERGIFQLHPVMPRTVYSVDELIVTPFKTRRFAGYLPPTYADAITNLVGPERPRRRSRRLYVTRSNASYRRISNEDKLMSRLSACGFECIELETLSIPEQAEAFYDASLVVAPHGAGLANLLYSHHAGVVEIFPSPEVTPHYFFLSKSRDLEYTPILGDIDNLNPDAFAVDVDDVLEAVDHIQSTSSIAS